MQVPEGLQDVPAEEERTLIQTQGDGGGGEEEGGGRETDTVHKRHRERQKQLDLEGNIILETIPNTDASETDAINEDRTLISKDIHCHICTMKETEIEPDRCSQKSSHSRSRCKLPRSCCCSPVFSPFCRQLLNVVVACLAGLCTGTIHAYPAVSLPRWEDMGFVLSTTQTTWFASTPMIVSVMVSWSTGIVVEAVGNRMCLIVGIVFLAISWIIIAMAESFLALMLGRILQGLVAAVYMVIITVYPAEVSTVRWRGIMVGISEAMVMLGAFLTYLAGLIMEPSPIAISLTLSLIPMTVAAYFLRDSPLWLARQDKTEEVASTLRCLRGPGVEIQEELRQIQESVASERIQKPSATEQLLLLRKLIYLKPVLLSILILLFKELTGQYAAMAYTVKIFKMAGSSLDPYLCAVVMGAARFLPCFVSWMLIERFPRKMLISTCMSLAALALALLGAFLWFWSRKEGLPPSLGWVPLLSLLVFTFVFGIGVGPTSWTLVAELLPSKIRNVGAGIITTSFSLNLFLVGLTFPFMVEGMGIGLVFIVYAACSMLGVTFVMTCLPETKGMSFSEIQSVLKGDKYTDSNDV